MSRMDTSPTPSFGGSLRKHPPLSKWRLSSPASDRPTSDLLASDLLGLASRRGQAVYRPFLFSFSFLAISSEATHVGRRLHHVHHCHERQGNAMVLQRRSGFTLIELLVGISIFTILGAIMLPAIQSSRESARLTSCRNNISQLSKGMIQHETYYGYFPSGGWSPQWLGVADRPGDSAQPGGWSFGVLPYIEELGARNTVANVPVGGETAAYTKLVTTSLPAFSCASRRSSKPVALTDTSFQGGALTLTKATRSDFAVNSGSVGSCPPVSAYKAASTALSKAITSAPKVCNESGCSRSSDSSSSCKKSSSTSKKSSSTSKKSSSSILSLFSSSKSDDDDDDDDERDDDDDDDNERDDDDDNERDDDDDDDDVRVVSICRFNDGDRVGACDSCASPVDAVMSHPKTLKEGDGWRKMSLADRVLKLEDRGIPDVQNGMCSRMGKLQAASVYDGLSNTYLIGEKCVDSKTYYEGSDEGDDSPMMSGYSSSTARWGSTRPCRDASGVSNATAFGSGHRGGWNAAYADGMVRTVSFDIDATLHSQLSCRNDGKGMPPKQ